MKNLVNIQNNQVTTTSKQIAVCFGKRHADVLRDIRRLISQVDGEFTKRNLAFCHEINHLQNGKPQPYYTLTKNAFVLLVMSYTDKKAMKFKLSYIQAFDDMQNALMNQEISVIARYQKTLLEYENACDKASMAGRMLNILGKQVKPQIKAMLDSLQNELQPCLPIEFDDEPT